MTLPHGHTAARPARRGIKLLIAVALAAGSLPALAMNPIIPPAGDAAMQAKPATVTPAPEALKALAPVAIATADNAPLDLQIDPAQIAALSEAAASPSVSARIKTVLQRAFTLLGTPYRWGGTSPERGFDCSGLVGYVFRTIGIDLPRVSRAMAHEGTAITDRTALTEGDLVFFGKRGKVDHVGIYIGEGKFLHAPRTGRDVTVSSLSSGYWSQKYLEARRVATGS